LTYKHEAKTLEYVQRARKYTNKKWDRDVVAYKKLANELFKLDDVKMNQKVLIGTTCKGGKCSPEYYDVPISVPCGHVITEGTDQ